MSELEIIHDLENLVRQAERECVSALTDLYIMQVRVGSEERVFISKQIKHGLANLITVKNLWGQVNYCKNLAIELQYLN